MTRPRTLVPALCIMMAAAASASVEAYAPRTVLAPAPGRDTPADTARVRQALQHTLDSLHAAGSFGGATAAVRLRDGTVISVAVGHADTVARTRMTPDSRMLAGSVGKTFFGALALQLVHEGRLDLDARLAQHLGDEPWWRDAAGRTRLPNGDSITLRMLMNHTSGIVRYEFNPAFTAAVTADPLRVWRPAEQVAFVLDTEPPFRAGAGWDYSDTNYILLAMVLEKVTGQRAYDMIRTRILGPLGLANTVPSDSPRIPGLVQGYAGAGNPFGGADAVLLADGSLAFNPQFEWAGGGFASTSPDLAHWVAAFHEGQAFDASLMPQVLDGVAARGLGQGVSYGLTTIIRDTPIGPAWGHSGFFPGYLTEARYYPDHGMGVAFQVNSSTARAIGRGTGPVVQRLAETTVAALAQ